MAAMRKMLRKLRRRRARRRVERFFAAVAHTLANDDPASEHYYWKISSQKQVQFQRKREGLVAVLGADATDHMLGVLSRRTRAPRRIVVLTLILLWLAPEPFALGQAPLLMLGTPLALLLGSILLSRSKRRVAKLLGSCDGYPLDDFLYGDIRRSVRRHSRHVPAAALSPHPQREVLAAHLGEHDPDTLEIAGKLAEEFDGTAVELLETARNLR